MKRIRCPKCDEAILFDETQYAPGRTLIFECPSCHKQFRLRIKGESPTQETPNVSANTLNPEEEEDNRMVYATVIVVENAFQLRQEIPLYEGDNIVGRHVPGTNANAAFKTVDPSVDTTHCVFTVKVRPSGRVDILLRDAPSNTGTFVGDHLLGRKETLSLADGDIITIGAATLICAIDDTEE